MSTTPNADETRVHLLAVSEALAPIREFVVGYKASLEAEGIHSTSADRMAEHVHAELINVAFRIAERANTQ